MDPWSYDASELNMDKLPEGYIYQNQKIKEYLDPRNHDRKFFLIGAKGCGKTLLLNYKSYLYWQKIQSDHDGSYHKSASQQLVESLQFNLFTFSRNEIEFLADLDVWQLIWKFSLTLVAIRRLKIDIPDYIKKDSIIYNFPENYRLHNIVNDMLMSQDKYLKGRQIYIDLNQLSALLNDNQTPITIFIDQLDQALNSMLSNPKYSNYVNKQGESVTFKVWQYAQCGLLLASYGFTTGISRHVKVFTTARHEALEVDNELMANVRNYCTFLEYDREGLKEIFERNIRNTPRKCLGGPIKGGNLYTVFFGFKELPHIIVKDDQQEPVTESVFDFVLRHTFERPRDIIIMGSEIYEKLLVRGHHERKPHKQIIDVRRVVNNAAHEKVLDNYVKEIVPTFNWSYIDNFVQLVKQNFILREEIEKVDNEIKNYLYRVGLIGYAKENQQWFLPASRHVYDMQEKLPVSEAYMTHPSLDHKLQQTIDYNDFYNRHCIIGNGYPYILPPSYFGTDFHQFSVEYFKPQTVPGRTDEPSGWEKANIHVAPDLLYQSFFLQNTSPNFIRFRTRLLNDAIKTLTTVASLTAIKLLRKNHKQGGEALNEWKEELLHRLELLKKEYTLSSRISDIDDACLHLFGGRIHARIIAAGILVYCKSEYYQVRQVLRHGQFQLTPTPEQEETAMRYLRTNLFLGNLANSHTPQTKAERRHLLIGLSNFEQNLLRKWWLHYKNHVIFEKRYLNDNDREYLKEIMGIN